MAAPPPPSFFKILLDPSAPHLPLPPEFVSRHLENKIPKDPIIRSANGGYLWQLKIKKFDESYCFTHGWSDVVKDIQLSFGDFLLFRLVDQSTFKMLVYSPNGCEKILPPKIKVEDDVGSVDDDAVVDLVDDDDHVEEEEEEDGDDDDGEEEEEDEDEDEEDGDDDSYDDEADLVVVDDGDEESNDDDEEDEDGIDGDDPYFMSTISPTYKNILRLPARFVELAGIEAGKNITVKNVDGEEWELGLRMEKLNHSNRYYLSVGWSEFRRGNGLSDGDKCLFKFITSESKLCLAKVTHKRRPPARQPQLSGETPASQVEPQLSGETPASQVEKKQRGRPRSVKMKRGRSPPAGETPATEIVTRKSGRSRPSGESPVGEVVRRSGRSLSSGKIPAEEVVKRKGRTTRRDDGGAVEVVKRSRGRPAKRFRGRPRQQ